MVIWLFAGGGPPEYSGLVKLLQKEFPGYHFERQLPQLAHKPKRNIHQNFWKIYLVKKCKESAQFSEQCTSLCNV